jgi:hypothetical protein
LQMESSKGSRAADALAVVTLLTTGAVIAWPIMSGGYLTYLDNPAHLAEVYAAASEARNGWSEIAFCGFPISTLHSPLWYGFLSLLARIGVGVSLPYVLCLWLGFTSPALALYGVARRVLTPLPATALAYLLLVQRPAIVGVGSAMGGMWTFFVATAGLILLIDRLMRPCVTRRDAGAVAALVGFILVTHLYTVVPLGLLALVHLLTVIGGKRGDPSRGRGRGDLIKQAAAAALGVLAAALYWVPMVLAGKSMVIHPQNLDAAMVVARLAMPTHVFDLVNRKIPAFTLMAAVESLPMVALIAAGFVGIFDLRRRANDVPLYGALMAIILLTLLLFVTGEFDVALFGPGSWRMLYFVRVGLALAAIPFAVRIAVTVRWRQKVSKWVALTTAGAAIASGLWFGRPLRAVAVPANGAEMAEVEALWDWLAKNRSEDWGRVYLQDTFELPRPHVKLSQSHILALTSHRTGVRQLGAFYGVAPYRTVSWTPSEFGTLFRKFMRDDEYISRIQAQMWATNSTHVVTSDPRTRRQLAEAANFRLLHGVGRFAVYRATQVASQWVSPLQPGVEVTADEFQTGRIRFDIRLSRPGAEVLVKSSYHPAWRVSTSRESRPRIRLENSGLMRLEGLDMGTSTIGIEYRPARWPLWLSAFGWASILAIYVTGKKHWAKTTNGHK